ncbi:MAG: sugar phosphate isomerase/epimerase [candidate division WOR-3 bacterium]|nr:sugar phosphate isomerase/epimerase [Candidatus Omnitrophota bacterium]MCM8807327.1 sugar phosphate isomerase/epimerase [Candidatus Omnitrophota bacterium]
MKIGLQLYTLRDFCKTVEDTKNTFKKIKEIGYNYVQISAVSEPKDVKELKKILDDNGLCAISTHTGYERIIRELEKVIEEHKILNCEVIFCPALPLELHNKEGYLKAAEEFNKVIEKIKKSGLCLGYHNHAIELEKYDGKTGLEILLDNCPELLAEIDTYWIQFGGGDPSFWIEKYKERVSQVHFKDMGIIKNKQVMPPIGDGNLNWERIIKSCKKSKVKYCLVEMDNPTIEPFSAIQKSLEYLKKFNLNP